MTKYIYIYFGILFFTLNSYSQVNPGFYGTLGLYQSSLKSSDLLTDTSSPGFYTGIDFNLGDNETFNYSFEMIYIESSFNLKTVNTSYELIESSKYTYANLQGGFYFNYYILQPDNYKFYLGPQIGLFLQGGTHLTSSNDKNPNDEKYLPHLLNGNSLKRSTNFNYGAGFGLTGGYNDFRFTLRYSLIADNILTDVETDSRNEYGIYTGPELKGTVSSISFGISYNIPFIPFRWSFQNLKFVYNIANSVF